MNDRSRPKAASAAAAHAFIILLRDPDVIALIAYVGAVSREIGFEAAIQSVIEDSREAAGVAARTVWRHPTFAELQRRRYGS